MASSEDAATAIIRELSSLSREGLRDNVGTRKKAIAMSKQLAGVLEDPVDTATQLVFSPYVAIAARTAVDLKLFEYIHEHSGPMSTVDLAQASKGEPQLITRLLRLLAGIGFVHEAAQDQWADTPVTAAMSNPAIASGYRFVWDVLVSSATMAPKYFRENGHRCPTEPTDGFVQYAQQTKHNFFAYLATKPSVLQDFNNFMGNTMGNKQYWVDWYPVEERLLRGQNSDTALLIDIGGGRGHDLQSFHSKYPSRGRLVLQDLPQGLEGIQDGELDKSIERMVYDFFTEQPVKGARTYFLHHILHDWSDEWCLKILAPIRDAMKPGYSRLLIHDLVLPDTGANVYQTIWDMTMMTVNGGTERSRTQWRELIAKAGLKLVKFHVEDPDADGIVEVEVEG